MDLPEGKRGIKVDSDSRKVFDGADYDKISHGHKESRRAIETDAQCRENGPRDHLGEQVEREILGAIERDWRRQNVVEGDGYDENDGWKDGVTSGARCDPKRVGKQSLAGGDSQHRRNTRASDVRVKTDVPRPSQPPSKQSNED